MTPPPQNAAYPAGLHRHEDLEEHTDVVSLHAVILREQAEPKEGQEPLSLVLVALMGALVFWGGFYLQRYSGGYKALEYDENASGAPPVQAAVAPAETPYDVGKRLFATTCLPCHKDDGQGIPGQFPPLAASDWVQAAGPARIIRIALDGLIGPVTVKGMVMDNPSGMVPWRPVMDAGTLTDDDLAAILTYVRGQKDWGNNAGPVKGDLVKAIREKTKAHAGTQWTAAELQKIPEVEP